MKKYIAVAALVSSFSGVSFAQVPEFELTFTGTLINPVGCTIRTADSSLAVALGSVDVTNLSSAVAKTSNLVFSDCAPNQNISLEAKSPSAGPGTVDGRLALDGTSTATGVEIEFKVGAGQVALPVGGAPVQVATNPAGVIADVTVVVESKLVTNSQTAAAGTVSSALTLTAKY